MFELGASRVSQRRVPPPLPRIRNGQTTQFLVDDQTGYLTTGESADGALGDVTIRMAKQGSTLAGLMDALGAAVSLGLRAGAPLDAYVSTFSNMRFAPAGSTDDPELPAVTSVMDYLARRLAIDYLSAEQRIDLGIYTAAERAAVTGPEHGPTHHPSLSASVEHQSRSWPSGSPWKTGRSITAGEA